MLKNSVRRMQRTNIHHYEMIMPGLSCQSSLQRDRKEEGGGRKPGPYLLMHH